MLIIAALATFALTFINLSITKRVLHPTVIYAGIWAIQLTALVFFSHRFIQPSNIVLLIVILGALVFSVGSHLTLTYTSTSHSLARSRKIRPGLVLYLASAAIVAICVIGQYQIFTNLLNDGDIGASLIYARTLMAVDTEDIYGIYKYGNPIALGSMLALQILMCREKYSHLVKYLFYYFLFASIFLAILTTGRGPVAFIFLQIGLVYVFGGRKNLLNWRFFVILLSFFLFVFLVFWIMGSIMGKADDNASGAVGDLVDYLFSSIPALSFYIDHYPIQFIGGDWGINTFRFFLSLGSKMGLVEGPVSLVQEFVPVPHWTNLYTTYLQYAQDFGWVGISLIPMFIGLLYGSLFNWTMKDRRNDFAFYLLVVSYLPLLQSVFQETHFSGMSAWLQFILIGLVLTKAIPNNTKQAAINTQ